MSNALRIEHDGHVLTRDEERHVFLDDERLPGPSGILEHARLSPDYSRIPPAVLEKARNRGTRVDLACDLVSQGRLKWESVHPNDLPYVEAWAKFCSDYGYESSWQQVLGWHPEHRYCAILDDVGWVPNERDAWVVERKATEKIDRSYALQLAAQTLRGFVCITPDGRIIEPRERTRALVHLKPTGVADLYTDLPSDRRGQAFFHIYDYPTFLWARAHYVPKRERKKAA